MKIYNINQKQDETLGRQSLLVKVDPLFVITQASHYFTVTRIMPQGRKLLDHFLTRWIHKGFKPQPTNLYRNKREPPDKIYGLCTKDLSEYRFHIGQLDYLKSYIRQQGFSDDYFPTVYRKPNEGLEIDSVVQPHWVLDETRKQPEVVSFILTPMLGDFSSRLITLPPGSGKTVCGLWALCQRKRRTAIIVVPEYQEKWQSDVMQITTAKNEDVMLVKGGDYIRGLIELAQTGQYDSDFVIISMRTWVMFIETYLENPGICRDEYGCHPDELLELLGIGTILIDEIHKQIHSVYKTLCFANVGLVIGLSATFLSNDIFVDKIQKTMFPKEIRFEDVKMKRYIRAYGISYSISADSMNKIKTSERGNTAYSQNAFEYSIIKSGQLMHRFLNLVTEVVENGFLDQYKPGHKCIIFVRRVDMCTKIVEHLRFKFSHLDIRRYTQEDPYENLLDPDIRVTTQQSAGTGHDIPGLMTNITLDNINAAAANIQCMGRLREPKEGIARYYTVFSESIKKHVNYYFDRRDLLMERVASFREFRSNVSL